MSFSLADTLPETLSEVVPTLCEAGLFAWPDYTLLGGMLVISTAIGLAFGLRGRANASTDDFLLGGSSMSVGPVALSLATSFITAIELLGNPAEMYSHGTQYWLICIPFIFVAPAAAYIYIPVFHKLRLTSSYEYLELRFGAPARTAGALMYVLQTVLYTSVAVYAPALALSHVTGLNVYVAVTCVYVVVIVYASQGGMKAVMMTDMFQAIVLAASLVLILGIGLWQEGGFAKVWDLSSQSDRIEFFNMDPNPTVRHSFWSVVIGGSFYWATMFCANQASIQKCLSVETIKQARSAIWVSAIVLIVVFTINFLTGMVLYAGYHGCDPLTTGEASEGDELLPLFVLEYLDYPALPGLFVAGVFAASLGTVAAALNSLTAVALKDLGGARYLPCGGAAAGRWLSIAFGIVSFGLVFLVERLGGVLQVALSFNGVVGGVTLGMFTLGMLFPWANSKGALTGAGAAALLVAWVCAGAQVAMSSGAIVHELKPTSIEECKCFNASTPITAPPPVDDGWVLSLYRISYLWYAALGCCTTVLLGLVVSLLTGGRDLETLDADLIAAPAWAFLRALPESLRTRLHVPSEPQETDLKEVVDNKKSVDLFTKAFDNPALVHDHEVTSYKEKRPTENIKAEKQ